MRWAGAGDVARRDKTEEHTCEQRICPSLSRPFAAGLASRLFVVVQSVLDVIRIPGTTVAASPVFPPYFLFFFCRLVLFLRIGTRGNNIVCCCLLYFTIKFSLFFAFLSPPNKVYAPGMHQGRMVIVLYQRSSLLPKIKWLC